MRYGRAVGPSQVYLGTSPITHHVTRRLESESFAFEILHAAWRCRLHWPLPNSINYGVAGICASSCELGSLAVETDDNLMADPPPGGFGLRNPQACPPVFQWWLIRWREKQCAQRRPGKV
jgi:hypothetical protein